MSNTNCICSMPDGFHRDDCPARSPTLKPSDAELRETIKWCHDRKHQKPWYGDGEESPKLLTTCDFTISVLTELLERRASGQVDHPVVKPLEWSNWSSHMRANSILGAYDIRHDGSEPEEWSVYRNGKLIACASTDALAKQESQKDFDAIVSSALASPQPNEPAGVTALDIEKAAARICLATGLDWQSLDDTGPNAHSNDSGDETKEWFRYLARAALSGPRS